MLTLVAASQGVLIFAILSWRVDELGKIGAYARQNWRIFSVSALAPFALSLLFSRLIFESQFIRHALATRTLAVVWGAWLLLIALLVATSGTIINFWARARRTWAFQNPPLQYLHVAATCLLFGTVGALLLRLPKISAEVMTLIGASGIAVSFWVVVTYIESSRAGTKGIFDKARPGFSFIPDDPISDELEDCLHRSEFTGESPKADCDASFRGVLCSQPQRALGVW